MLEKCVLTILELNWNQRLGHTKTKLNICHNMLTSSTQLQKRSFHVAERTRTSSNCQQMKNVRAKRAKILFFCCQICKFVGFLLPSSSWLLKLSIVWKRALNIPTSFSGSFLYFEKVPWLRLVTCLLDFCRFQKNN